MRHHVLDAANFDRFPQNRYTILSQINKPSFVTIPRYNESTQLKRYNLFISIYKTAISILIAVYNILFYVLHLFRIILSLSLSLRS